MHSVVSVKTNSPQEEEFMKEFTALAEETRRESQLYHEECIIPPDLDWYAIENLSLATLGEDTPYVITCFNEVFTKHVKSYKDENSAPFINSDGEFTLTLREMHRYMVLRKCFYARNINLDYDFESVILQKIDDALSISKYVESRTIGTDTVLVVTKDTPLHYCLLTMWTDWNTFFGKKAPRRPAHKYAEGGKIVATTNQAPMFKSVMSSLVIDTDGRMVGSRLNMCKIGRGLQNSEFMYGYRAEGMEMAFVIPSSYDDQNPTERCFVNMVLRLGIRDYMIIRDRGTFAITEDTLLEWAPAITPEMFSDVFTQHGEKEKFEEFVKEHYVACREYVMEYARKTTGRSFFSVADFAPIVVKYAKGILKGEIDYIFQNILQKVGNIQHVISKFNEGWARKIKDPSMDLRAQVAVKSIFICVEKMMSPKVWSDQRESMDIGVWKCALKRSPDKLKQSVPLPVIKQMLDAVVEEGMTFTEYAFPSRLKLTYQNILSLLDLQGTLYTSGAKIMIYPKPSTDLRGMSHMNYFAVSNCYNEPSREARVLTSIWKENQKFMQASFDRFKYVLGDLWTKARASVCIHPTERARESHRIPFIEDCHTLLHIMKARNLESPLSYQLWYSVNATMSNMVQMDRLSGIYKQWEYHAYPAIHCFLGPNCDKMMKQFYIVNHIQEHERRNFPRFGPLRELHKMIIPSDVAVNSRDRKNKKVFGGHADLRFSTEQLVGILRDQAQRKRQREKEAIRLLTPEEREARAAEKRNKKKRPQFLALPPPPPPPPSMEVEEVEEPSMEVEEVSADVSTEEPVVESFTLDMLSTITDAPTKNREIAGMIRIVRAIFSAEGKLPASLTTQQFISTVKEVVIPKLQGGIQLKNNWTSTMSSGKTTMVEFMNRRLSEACSGTLGQYITRSGTGRDTTWTIL